MMKSVHKITLLLLISSALAGFVLFFLVGKINYYSNTQITSQKSKSQNQFEEILAKRSETGKVFRDVNSPNKYVYEGGIAPVHYENTNNNISQVKEVNFTPLKISNSSFDGWEVTENDWHFRIGADKSKNEDGWVGFGGQEGKKWFRYRLENIGSYNSDTDIFSDLAGEANYDRNYFRGEVQPVSFSPTKQEVAAGLHIFWNNLWPEFGEDNIFLRLRASGTGLKEEIVVREEIRDQLFSSESAQSDNDYFGFTFELDLSEVPKMYREGIEMELSGDTQVLPAEKVELRDELNRLIAFMPVDDLIVVKDGDEVERKKLKKIIFEKDGKPHLFIGITKDSLYDLPSGDVIFDPTIDEQISADGNDGQWDETFNGFTVSNHNINYGRSYGPGVEYRVFLRFTGVSAEGTITDASIEYLAGNSATSTLETHITAEDSDNPSAPTSNGDAVGRTRTSAYTVWNDPQNVGGNWLTSPDISNVIQELVDTYTISNEAILLFIEPPLGQGIGTERKLRDYYNSPSNAAKLHIEYTTSGSMTQSHYRWRDDSAGINTDSGWLAAADTSYGSMTLETSYRLRVAIDNLSGSSASNYVYQLEYAPKNGGTCGDNETFTEIPSTATSEHFEMVNSSQFTDGDTISSSFLAGAGTFANGEAVEYSSNQTASHTLASNYYTEFEFSIQATANANSASYCFRATNDGTALGTYSNYAEVSLAINSAPSAPQVPHISSPTQSGKTSPATGIWSSNISFSAIFDDPNTSDTAEYYQIQVGTDTDWGTAEMWDSTQTTLTSCNEGERCSDIDYAGSAVSDGSTYYWRIRYWDDSGEAGAWSTDQQFTINYGPTVTQVVVNNDSDITLTAGTTTTVEWTAVITDPDGNADIDSALGRLYETSDGPTCSNDNQTCYNDPSCTLSNCSGNSCDVLCSVEVEFFANSTDSTGQYPAENWRAIVTAQDINGEGDSDLSTGREINSLVALDIDASLNYGTLSPGEDSGSTNETTTITNVGNVEIDSELSGSDMCTDYPTCSGNSIGVGNQKFSTSTFTYSSGGTALTTSAASVVLNLAKSTTSPSNSTTNIYWGIAVPGGTGVGNYTGENTAVAENSQ